MRWQHENQKNKAKKRGEEEETTPRMAQPATKRAKTFQEKEQGRRLIIVLDSASLETVKVGHEFGLLNCDDHVSIMKKSGRDPAEARPDITHQVFCFSTQIGGFQISHGTISFSFLIFFFFSFSPLPSV